MTFNIPEYYIAVSRRLNKVLDTIGMSEDIRWKRTNMWIQSEELFSVTTNNTCHFFGSQAEATTTPGLQSDIDCVLCDLEIVLQHLEDWVYAFGTHLVVTDENTPPGYVKLQCVRRFLPQHVHNVLYKLDRYGRTVASNDNHYLKWTMASEHHGPANTLNDKSRPLGTASFDVVKAKRLHSWPNQAFQWLTRNRQHSWPSEGTIDLIKQTGALLVPVGHKLSPEQHLEWRISISYGEKLLIWLMNSTQYKCYILLKMINKSFIKPVVGDDVLSSYHCKTCIFYLIEKTPTAMWQPDNLLLCVELCLRLLYKWVDNKTCPNYFIPEENMFQCKVYGNIQSRLLGVLSDLLRQEGRYLSRISCDNIGHNLVRTCQTPLMQLESACESVGNILKETIMVLYCCLHSAMIYGFNEVLMFQPRILDRLFSCPGPRHDVITILWKLYCSYIGSKLTSESLCREIHDQQCLEVAQELLLWGSSSDVTSGNLKLAAFYLIQDDLDNAEDVLNEILENYSHKTFNLHNISQRSLHSLLCENLSTSQLARQYIAFPVLYHHSEITLAALIPEVICSTESYQIDLQQHVLQQNKFIEINPEFYLYFLKFLCHRRQNKRSHREAALDNMIFVIRYMHGPVCKHTALNLLAYCLMQEGRLMNAYIVLSRSMKLMKQNNAAKWHIATLISAAFRFLRVGQ